VDPPREPVFILGSPRSGTTLLFEVLNRSPDLASLDAESHLLWQMFHDVGRRLPRSHEVRPEDITPRERRALAWAVDRVARGRRYLDKSPRNSLRVPYLMALFPDAWFVFLKRDGRAVVSSLITGWRAKDSHFPGTRLPRALSIEGYEGANWKFLVPPGWERFATGHTLAEVCAFQWVAANEAILAGRDQVRTERWVELAYEEFVAAPREGTAALLERLGVPAGEAVLSLAAELDRHVAKAVSAPRPEKWREENPAEVASVLPAITPMMRRLGYEIEERSERPGGSRGQ
jgi:hypothetical protein